MARVAHAAVEEGASSWWGTMDNDEPDRGNFDVHVGIGLIIILAMAFIGLVGIHLIVDLLTGVPPSNVPSM